MNRLEEIANFVIQNRYKSVLGYSDGELQNWIKDKIKQYTEECIKASLEKASEKAIAHFEEDKVGEDITVVNLVVSKGSITNLENIILL